MYNRLLYWFSQPTLAHWFVLLLPVILLLPLMMMPQTLDDLVHHHVFSQSLALFSESRWWTELFVFLDGNPDRTQQVVQQFLLPWWTDSEVKIAFFRPLSALTHWIDYQLWPYSHALNHLHSFFWLGLLIALVFKLYRSVEVDYRIAILAGLLFAFDASHFISSTWVANRNILVAGVVGVMCLISLMRYKQSNQLKFYWLSLMLFALCLFSAEAGVSIGAFIFAYLICLDRSRLNNKVLILLGFGVVFIAWYAFYKTLGYGASGNDFYLDPANSPSTFFSSLSWKYPLYVLMYFIGLPSAGYYSGGLPPMWLLLIALLMVVALGLLLWPILKKSVISRFWLLSFLLALLPISGSSPHERTMVIAGIAANALMAILLVNIFSKKYGLMGEYRFMFGTIGRKLLIPVVGLFILLHGVIHPLGLLVIPVSTWAIHDENPFEAQIELLPNMTDKQKGRIYINSPSTLYVGTLNLYRASQLDKTNVLEPQFLLTSNAQTVKIERRDSNTLRLYSPTNISPTTYDGLFRSKHKPIKAGQTYRVGEMTVKVIAVNGVGLPVVTDYSWPYSVDELQALGWKGERFERVSLPKARGNQITIEPKN